MIPIKGKIIVKKSSIINEGLIITKTTDNIYEVVSVSSGSNLKVGDIVVVSKFEGTSFDYQGETYYTANESTGVLAIIEK
jgi:co-chaperonin GroES (HSP10)